MTAQGFWGVRKPELPPKRSAKLPKRLSAQGTWVFSHLDQECRISRMEPSTNRPVESHPSKSSLRARVFVALLFVAVFAFGVGYSLGVGGYKAEVNGIKVNISRDLPSDKKELDFSLFWQVWDTVKESYFDTKKINDANLVWGAIKGMVAAVGDPYTVFLTPDEQRVTQEDLSGNFEGIGIQIGYIGTQLAVIAPLPGSPSEEVGIKAGDIIVGIKDEARGVERGTVGISLPEAVQLIRGKAGSKVTLSLLREGQDEPLIMEVTRQEIKVPSVTLKFVGEGGTIAHLKIHKFGEETFNEWGEAVLEIQKKQNLAGIIVDVRNNPGGYLQGAVDLGSEFLEKGDVVVVEEYANGSKDEFFVEETGKLSREKIVVLINGGSASASEILAGALRDIKKTPIVGETSFGKGTVQDVKVLAGGTGLHITVARWLTPSGYWVDGNGLTPDIELPDNPETEEDEQLTRAIEVVNNFSSLSGR